MLSKTSCAPLITEIYRFAPKWQIGFFLDDLKKIQEILLKNVGIDDSHFNVLIKYLVESKVLVKDYNYRTNNDFFLFHFEATFYFLEKYYWRCF